MATLQLTIPNNKVDRVVSAVCKLKGYQELLGGVENPETKQQFFERMVRQQVKAWVAEAEGEEARLAARDAVANDEDLVS